MSNGDCLTPREIEFQDKIAAQIDEFGWSVVVVPDGEPTFGYSVGLTEQDLPEIFMSGNLHPETIQTLINTVAQQAVGREHEGEMLVPGTELRDVLANDLTLGVATCNPVAAEMNVALGFFGKERVRAVQLVWPDPEGNMPWDAEWSMGDGVQPLYPLPADS